MIIRSEEIKVSYLSQSVFSVTEQILMQVSDTSGRLAGLSIDATRIKMDLYDVSNGLYNFITFTAGGLNASILDTSRYLENYINITAEGLTMNINNLSTNVYHEFELTADRMNSLIHKLKNVGINLIAESDFANYIYDADASTKWRDRNAKVYNLEEVLDAE